MKINRRRWLELAAATTLGGLGVGAWRRFATGDARYFGRIEDPEAAAAFRSQLPVEWFGDTDAGQVRLDDESDVLLTDAAIKVLGAHLPARDQGQVGSCVSFGTATAAEYLLLGQIVRSGGDKSGYADLCQEVIYGGSRVEIGGGKVQGDGSRGSWGAAWVNKYGLVRRGIIAGIDLTTYDERRCREYGSKGVPDVLEPIAKESPVKTVTTCRNFAEVAKAIRQGYPIATSSNQGFSSTRDGEGFAKAQGQWSHCMAILGVRGGNRPGALIANSWGPNWIKGPKGSLPIPDGSFWAEPKTIDRMCSEGETFAFSDAVGFPSRNPFNPFAAVPARDNRVVAAPAASS